MQGLSVGWGWGVEANRTLEHSWNLNSCPFLTWDHFPLHPLLRPGREHPPFCLRGTVRVKALCRDDVRAGQQRSSPAFRMQHLSLGQELVKQRDAGMPLRPGERERKREMSLLPSRWVTWTSAQCPSVICFRWAACSCHLLQMGCLSCGVLG